MAETTYLPPKSYYENRCLCQAKIIAFQASMTTPEVAMALASCEG